MTRDPLATIRKTSLTPWARALVLSFGLASVAAAAEMYLRTVVDPSGQLHIVTKHHREIIPRKEREQVGFAKAQISPDGRAVGWLALYPNCCTSYPVPMKLVIQANGRQRIFTGSGLPIWRWCFEDEGKQVAFEQETVHGGIGVHYELRSLENGQLVEKYDPGPNADADVRPPKWVADLDSKR